MMPRAAQDAPEPDTMHLRTPQRRRRGFRLFIALVLLVVVGLGATLLLANGERNLRILSARFNALWPLQAADALKPKDMPPPARGKRVETRSVLVPSRTFMVPRLLEMGAFVRSISFSGKTLCEKLNAAGLPNGEWAQSVFGPGVFDCSVDVTAPSAQPDGDTPSFFLIVRGNQAGQIGQIRWKIININNSPKLLPLYLKSIDVLNTVSKWGDFSPQFESMRALRPFEVNHFGLAFKFVQEATGTTRYNITMMVDGEGELQRSTRAVLNARSRFVNAPLEKVLWPRQSF